ncbi:hypothetical protein [Streptomyces sp. NPDC006640]
MWRTDWDGGWTLTELEAEDSAPREVGLDELLVFAADRLRD